MLEYCKEYFLIYEMEYCKKEYFQIYESVVMYFIVAYYGCVGLIAALGEQRSISMRGETKSHNLQLKTTKIDKNSESVERFKTYNWTIEYLDKNIGNFEIVFTFNLY